jgi:hypothetical protein
MHGVSKEQDALFLLELNFSEGHQLNENYEDGKENKFWFNFYPR